ncbi:MAG: imidazole glycerol phosphate synthase subunit HisF [Bacteroidia bacterium]|nr:imidazole glycerol phosphate synthase subunit HisF [Bacteroidia bacterium]
MRRIRVIPTLLIQNGGLVKGKNFKNHQYVGDPINSVRIFNEKEVDELAIIDISATKQRKVPNIIQIAEIASEAFMPLSYGGGITNLEQADQIFFNGIEKVILNYSAVNNPVLITQIANKYGNQSVVASMDVKKNWSGKTSVYTGCGNENTKKNPVQFARECESRGAGEILLTSVDREGTYMGYDIILIREICNAVSVPVIANGGAGGINHFKEAIANGASAVAAGNMFIYQRPRNAVLISYLNQQEINSLRI